MDQVNSLRGSSPSRSFLSRTLMRRDGDGESAEDLRGRFGLNILHEPSEASAADLVFVHGLGGGSRSTWTKEGGPSPYWPQEWLPKDSGFQDVRILSFGYNSNWDKESTLNIHDFAKSLLGCIQDHPLMPRGSNIPLVFVGHSMGGLVIKRACILAKQKHDFMSLAQRIKAIVFLATPHRGADLAQTLSRILSISSGARPFVSDLQRNSITTQSINDEFPQYCQDLQLYSFYETLPISYGIGKSLIVEKDSATLGYPNERTAYLNANHRDVCKYIAQTDPNYQTVRNALASIIDKFRIHAVSSKNEVNLEQQRLLDGYLGVSDAPENDFMDAENVRMRGSCEWLVNKASFQTWRDASCTGVYWLSAKPATGKTVLSGKVIHHLKDLNRDIVFYFFDYRSKSKTAVASFLLSVAWQMAYRHSELRNKMVEICEKDDQIQKADYRTIWRKLYVEGILRTKFTQTQYWVIDALDECKSGSDLVPLLLKAIEMPCSVRIFLTSRDQPESYRRALIHPTVKIFSEQMSEADTKSDIMLFLEANMDQLPSIDEEARKLMVAKIIAKSAGCFLWVSLILQELRRVHTSAEIRQVLDEVPSDMNELYSRILDSMSKASYGKVLAKAILVWTVCSTRPLTTDELYHALQLDMKDSIDSVNRSIVSSCGQLVYVDGQSRVQIIHQTARDFLLQAAGDSEFAIDGQIGNKRLAMTCLEYLNSSEMKGPKHRKLSSTNVVQQRCPFVNYACSSFFKHIAHVTPTDEDLFFALTKFLNSSNVLSWIEHIALNSDLNQLIQAGIAFKNLLQRRASYLSPIGREVALLDSWSNDLVRLVTKFGKNLLATPTSIFNLIPPFCPSGSAPRKQFAASTRGITVLGLSSTTWDDCLSTIVSLQEQFLALACSDKYFAIGMSSGKIVIYNNQTCQETRTLKHKEAVRILQFGRKSHVLVSTGNKSVCVWNLTSWEQTWEFGISHQCLSVVLMEEEQLLLGALKNNRLMIWDLTTGDLKDSSDWTEDLEGPISHAHRRPIAASFCTETNLLAVVYRGQDILVWDLERDTLHETYCKDTGIRSPTPDRKRSADPGATGVIFSPAPNATLLAATYADGDLVLFDTSEGIVKHVVLANAQTLACSPNGRTLASGNSSGTIEVFDFETLKLLYRINSGEYSIKCLAFSTDNHRLLDIRGSECRTWDPTVLVRQDLNDENSDTVSVSTVAQAIDLESSDDVVLITSLACNATEDVFFVGKEDGSISSYEAKSGRQKDRLFRHADGVSVLSLSFDADSHIIISTDSSSCVMAHQLFRDQQGWKSGEILLSHRAGVAVDQVLSDRNSTLVLICTAKHDTLLSISSSESRIVHTIAWQERGPYRWMCHPNQQDQLILVTNGVAHLYDWQNLQRLTGSEGILLEGSILPELAVQSVVSCSNGAVIATAFGEKSQPFSESKLLLWKSADFNMRSESAVPVPRYTSLAEKIKRIIGSDGRRVVFLDGSNWICSADLQATKADEYQYHFFLPAEWLSANTDLIIGVTHKRDIIFIKRDEVAVIKRGLDNVEQSARSISATRPSLISARKAILDVRS